MPPPPPGGRGRKGLIIGIVAGVVVLVLGVVAVLAFTVFDGDDDDPAAEDETSASADASRTDEPSEPAEEPTESDEIGMPVPSDLVDLTDSPEEDPTITARAFLDSLLEGNCLAVEGLSTPEYFASEFTDQDGCEAVAGDLELSNAEYTFDEPTIVGSYATVTGDVYAPTTGKTLDSTWLLNGSTGEWLINGYSYTEK